MRAWKGVGEKKTRVGDAMGECEWTIWDLAGVSGGREGYARVNDLAKWIT